MTNPISMIRNVQSGGIEYRALMFWCPGCVQETDGIEHGGLHMLPIQPYPGEGPSWAFSGTVESPTLEPSILSRSSGGFICHSYLRNGVFEFLDDCTHKHKGQHVPTPPLPNWVVSL